MHWLSGLRFEQSLMTVSIELAKTISDEIVRWAQALGIMSVELAEGIFGGIVVAVVVLVDRGHRPEEVEALLCIEPEEPAALQDLKERWRRHSAENSTFPYDYLAVCRRAQHHVAVVVGSQQQGADTEPGRRGHHRLPTRLD